MIHSNAGKMSILKKKILRVSIIVWTNAEHNADYHNAHESYYWLTENNAFKLLYFLLTDTNVINIMSVDPFVLS